MSSAPTTTDDTLRISWSRLREWEECSEKGWLVRQGHRAPTAEIWPAMFQGTVVDRCMREWLAAEAQEPGAMAAMVGQIMDREEQVATDTGDGQVRWRGTGARNEAKANCVECVNALEPLLFQYVVPFEYQVAYRFKAPMQVPHPDGKPRQIFLTGELDLLVRQGGQEDGPGMRVPGTGELRVYDLKMTRDSSYWRKTMMQLPFYEVAVRLLYGSWPVESALIQPLCEQPYLPFTFGEERSEILQRVARMAEAIWLEQHSPKASTAGCDRCYVKHACVRFARVGKRVPVTRLCRVWKTSLLICGSRRRSTGLPPPRGRPSARPLLRACRWQSRPWPTSSMSAPRMRPSCCASCSRRLSKRSPKPRQPSRRHRDEIHR